MWHSFPKPHTSVLCVLDLLQKLTCSWRPQNDPKLLCSDAALLSNASENGRLFLSLLPASASAMMATSMSRTCFQVLLYIQLIHSTNTCCESLIFYAILMSFHLFLPSCAISGHHRSMLLSAFSSHRLRGQFIFLLISICIFTAPCRPGQN